MSLRNANLSNYKIREEFFFPALKIANSNCIQVVEWIDVPAESATILNTANEEKVLIVMNGNGGLIVNGLTFFLESGDVMQVPSNSIRSLANIGSESLRILSVRYKNI